MTNEEVFERAHDEFVLRGMSPQTEESYLCALRLFLRYHDDRPIEAMGEPEIREFLLYQISIGKETGSVNSAARRRIPRSAAGRRGCSSAGGDETQGGRDEPCRRLQALRPQAHKAGVCGAKGTV